MDILAAAIEENDRIGKESTLLGSNRIHRQRRGKQTVVSGASDFNSYIE